MHRSVLSDEVVQYLAVRPGGTYIDGTAGGGGHSAAIHERGGLGTRILLIDRDPQALVRARARIGEAGQECLYVHGNFADMQRIADENRIGTVDGVLLDLGISSDQLDSPERGFSFMHEGPLDMRMDQGHTPSAEQMINSMPEESLAELLRSSGEEPAARRIARAIVTARQVSPIRTTGQLAEIVARATGGRRGRLHPATRTFQAIRIGVNDELENLDRALPAALALLKPGGRLVIISFHSLEDRKVKQFIAGHAGRWVACQAGGRTWEGVEPSVTNLTKKPVIAGDAEVEANPRARSAKLRAAERNR